MLESVGYLTQRLPDDIDRTPVASVFFISVPVWEHDTTGVVWVVTAGHVINEAQSIGPIYVRLNLRDGGFEDVELPFEGWIQSRDSDVAIAPFAWDDSYWATPLILSHALPLKEVQDLKLGIGDEVAFVGLFSQHPGTVRNLPIARFGAISRMPFDEKLRVEIRRNPKETREIEAYLVEARSWGGHSGSPAFAVLSPIRQPGHIVGLDVGGRVGFPGLLGLVQGHYNIPSDVPFVGDILPGGFAHSVNSGMAVVVPSWSILALLEGAQVKGHMERTRTEADRQKATPIPDTVSPPDEANLTRSEFEDALRRATRKVDQPKDES